MKRITSTTKIGDNKTRYRTRIEDDPSPPQSDEARWRLHHLFSEFAAQPDLIACGSNSPQKMIISHSGEGWVVEAEAVVEVQ